jgi:hypothetical protein
MVAPMLASYGSGQPSGASTTVVASTAATTQPPVSSTTVPSASTSVTLPASTSSVAGSQSSNGVTTTRPTSTGGAVTDAQVASLEQTLNAIDSILANLDKSLASDATLAP